MKPLLLFVLAAGLAQGQPPSANARRIQGRNVAPTAPTSDQVMLWGGAISAAAFSGTGLNDATSGGTYTGNVNATFEVVIDASVPSPDTFKWRKDGGAWTEGVAITGAAQTLSNGVTVTFAAVDGHTVADKWTIAVSTQWQPGTAGDAVQGAAALITAGVIPVVSATPGALAQLSTTATLTAPAAGILDVSTTAGGIANLRDLRTRSVTIAATNYTAQTEGGCGVRTNFVVDAVLNTKVTSVTYNFVAADVGATFQVTAGAGWTTGDYTIVSVAANAATLDRSPAAVGTTGGTANYGRGRQLMVQGGAGVADTSRICTKDAADAYGWRALY